MGAKTGQHSAAPRSAARNLRCSASKNPARQNKGFFSEEDPTAEVLPVRKGLGGGSDPTKRGGRYDPEFIWQANWQSALDAATEKAAGGGEASSQSTAAGPAVGEAGSGKGFLSLGSKLDLNDMSLDLSAQLRARPTRRGSGAAAPASAAAPSAQQQRRGPEYGSIPVTRVEQRAWERGSGFAKRVVPVAPTNPAAEAEQEAALAAERARYETLKAELQLWAAGLTAACLVATFAFYGRETAASYGVGALGGLVYLRLLNRSVDAVGQGGVGGALGQPRLLIPVILTLGYNRYNQLLAEDVGITLQLLPMLAGFFTYKGAVVAKTALDFAKELTGSVKGQQAVSSSSRGDGSASGANVTSVDRAFRSKVLRG